MRVKFVIAIIFLFSFTHKHEELKAWIRINQLGYQPTSVKVAVWCSKEQQTIRNWQLVDAVTKKVVLSDTSKKSFGEYGPFKQTYSLNFSSFKNPGK